MEAQYNPNFYPLDSTNAFKTKLSMIVSDNIAKYGKPSYKVNINYPDNIEDAKRLVVFVHSDNINVVVSKVFSVFENLTYEGLTVSKSAFPFDFWFFTEEEAKRFTEEWNGDMVRIIPIPKSKDFPE